MKYIVYQESRTRERFEKIEVKGGVGAESPSEERRVSGIRQELEN